MPIHGRPLLDYWLASIQQMGTLDTIVNLHYLKREVSKYLRRPCYAGWIRTFEEHELLGTAGSLRAIANQYRTSDKTLLVIHADNWSDCDLSAFLDFHRSAVDRGILMTMMTFDTDAPTQCGIVETDSNNTLIGFHEKQAEPPGNRANAAVYAMEPALVDWLNQHPTVNDISTQLIPEFMGRICCWHHSGIHRDIGTVPSLLAAQCDPPHPNPPQLGDDWQHRFNQHQIHRELERLASEHGGAC